MVTTASDIIDNDNADCSRQTIIKLDFQTNISYTAIIYYIVIDNKSYMLVSFPYLIMLCVYRFIPIIIIKIIMNLDLVEKGSMLAQGKCIVLNESVLTVLMTWSQ